LSKENGHASEAAVDEGLAQIRELFGDAEPATSAKYAAGSEAALESFREWMSTKLNHTIEADKLAEMDEKQVTREVILAIDDRFHPEMRRMERQVLLQIVDASWKDHLLAMDHLRSAIGLKGYAQMDPKVEYKREGMRMYGDMWFSIGERMTDLIFRMEALDTDFIASTMPETVARHDAAPSALRQAAASSQQEADLAAADRAGAEPKGRVDPIRNVGQKVGRNDPCPCGSGKKYKACHGRN
jgi:preprotein translocase subunit SecA